jgi:phosphoglycerate dehydrogenase-like enzyme
MRDAATRPARHPLLGRAAAWRPPLVARGACRGEGSSVAWRPSARRVAAAQVEPLPGDRTHAAVSLGSRRDPLESHAMPGASGSLRGRTLNVGVYVTHPAVPCWNFDARHERHLRERLPGTNVYRARDEAEFLQLLPRIDIAVVWRFERSWLERAPRLEWIVTPAAGRDYFSVPARDGLEVTYGSFHGPIIAETVLGMLIGQCRGLFVVERLRETRPWPRAELAREMRLLRGARITILGFGSIGRWIGRLAKPFGVKITGVTRTRHERPDYFDADDRLLTVDSLDETLGESDFLIVVLPATPQTDRIIDARRIALLSPDAVLVNVGRGNALDEDALAEALRAGRLGAAYLDVYDEEPLPASSPLRNIPNAFLFPHAAAIAPEYLDLFIEELGLRFESRYSRN